MDEREKQMLITILLAIRIGGLNLDKQVRGIPHISDDERLRLVACANKLEEFDALITQEIDRLRYEDK